MFFYFFFKLSYLDNRPVAPETTITLNGYQNGEPERDLEKYFKSLQGNLYYFIIYACLHWFKKNYKVYHCGSKVVATQLVINCNLVIEVKLINAPSTCGVICWMRGVTISLKERGELRGRCKLVKIEREIYFIYTYIDMRCIHFFLS